jgi:hypothetical protein
MTQLTCKGVKQINNRISLNMTFTFTICISRRFSSTREFQMGNFQIYWSQNVGQVFIVLDFFHGRKILKVDGRDPQNWEKNAPAGKFTCMQVVTECRYSRVDEKRREIQMVKVNVIFNDIRLLICLTPLQVNWVMVIN